MRGALLWMMFMILDATERRSVLWAICTVHAGCGWCVIATERMIDFK